MRLVLFEHWDSREAFILWVGILFASSLVSSTLTDPVPDNAAAIVGGEDAQEDRYPWMVDLLSCGGTLIAPDIVLSAAHCEDSVSRAVVGGYDQAEYSNLDYIGISEKIVHPGYFQKDETDVMLLKLRSSSSAPIVTLNERDSVPSVGQNLKVIGWGALDQDGVEGTPDVLQEVTVKSISNQECANIYPGLINDEVLCAKDDGRDACHGDSGGPLFVAGGGYRSDVQVGIVSWGKGCADPSFPGVYVRVASVYDWIKTGVCASSADPPASFGCSGTGKSDDDDDAICNGPVFDPDCK